MTPKVVLASKAKATQVTLNAHWGVDKDTLHVKIFLLVEKGCGARRLRTNLTMGDTCRSHICIGCRDATGFMCRVLGEGP